MPTPLQTGACAGHVVTVAVDTFQISPCYLLFVCNHATSGGSRNSLLWHSLYDTLQLGDSGGQIFHLILRITQITLNFIAKFQG